MIGKVNIEGGTTDIKMHEKNIGHISSNGRIRVNFTVGKNAKYIVLEAIYISNWKTRLFLFVGENYNSLYPRDDTVITFKDISYDPKTGEIVCDLLLVGSWVVDNLVARAYSI
ncbi:MAG: hypothetical protein RR536_01890 [Anaerovoracaceae bacterium]